MGQNLVWMHSAPYASIETIKNLRFFVRQIARSRKIVVKTLIAINSVFGLVQDDPNNVYPCFIFSYKYPGEKIIGL